MPDLTLTTFNWVPELPRGFVRDLRVPFGGSRNSGIGREGGVRSFDFYADVKNICVAPWERS